ncbi:amidohydrolase [Hoeflea sp. YIM 152468]|uniref:amidohydrolase n=1 Tax=Hoeflea sp. YIM 152468 TaxID=3031759 RepID=UPI0023DC6424|nr:amidohydrolase [Hoeflea sp. YIM 152468]MDF1608339.1 amidohydrolase [Hoeflea sp. YIM 152468]
MTTPAMDKIIALRHWLHAHPEVSRQEVETAKYLRLFLQEHATPDEFLPLHGAGFAAIYAGREAGKTVLIRAELDALPIHEINLDLPYRSIHDGVGHKCGHDGHMAIVAGLAQALAAQRPEKGRVALLFQPDEETGSGARNCCHHPNYAKIAPDYAFALHNLPGFAAGQIICRTGTFASAVKYAAVRLAGKEAHSAQPETGASPSFAMARITLMAQELQQEFETPSEYALIVPVYSQMGVQASGVCPGAGEVHVTLRSGRGEALDAMWQAFSDRATHIAHKSGLEIRFETREEYTETRNNAEAVEMIVDAADALGLSLVIPEHPFRWGEDYGEIAGRCKGAMFGLGAGLDRPALHNPDYDFPDAIIEPGIAMFRRLVERALG